eukprot:3225800-Rhodomonas_salina.1
MTRGRCQEAHAALSIGSFVWEALRTMEEKGGERADVARVLDEQRDIIRDAWRGVNQHAAPRRLQ